MSNKSSGAILLLILSLGLFRLPAMAQRHGRASVYRTQSSSIVLRIQGAIPRQLVLTQKDLHSFPRSRVQVLEGSGESSTYEGVALVEILRKAGVPIGGQNKKELQMCVEVVSR